MHPFSLEVFPFFFFFKRSSCLFLVLWYLLLFSCDSRNSRDDRILYYFARIAHFLNIQWWLMFLTKRNTWMHRSECLRENPFSLMNKGLLVFLFFFSLYVEKAERHQFHWVYLQINHRCRIVIQVFTVFLRQVCSLWIITSLYSAERPDPEINVRHAFSFDAFYTQVL